MASELQTSIAVSNEANRVRFGRTGSLTVSTSSLAIPF
jgi:hypothetical protein